MTTVSATSALSVRLLLLLLLALTPTGAGADRVTWPKCWLQGIVFKCRVINSPPDNSATELIGSFCYINEIRRVDFDGLPNLNNISLNNNDIAHIDPVVFRSVPKLTRLALSNNKLRELPVFDEPSSFPSLTRLHLESNKFTVIQYARTFSACVQLLHLSLSHNLIKYINPDVFKALTELTHLYLNNNKITYITETMFVNNNKLTELWLNDNRMSFLPVNFVTELSNAGARLRVFYFHDNPWPCACLLELLADVRRVGDVTYHGGDIWHQYHPRYDGTRRVCEYSGAFPCSRHAPSGLLRALPRAPASSRNPP